MYHARLYSLEDYGSWNIMYNKRLVIMEIMFNGRLYIMVDMYMCLAGLCKILHCTKLYIVEHYASRREMLYIPSWSTQLLLYYTFLRRRYEIEKYRIRSHF